MGQVAQSVTILIELLGPHSEHIYIYVYKVKLNFTLEQATKLQTVSSGIALTYLLTYFMVQSFLSS